MVEELTYVEYVEDALVGRTIVHVRPMNKEELALFGWDEVYGSTPMLILLNDMTAIIPSQDPEGNGAGHLFITEAE
jgi:hypothetical protein